MMPAKLARVPNEFVVNENEAERSGLTSTLSSAVTVGQIASGDFCILTGTVRINLGSTTIVSVKSWYPPCRTESS